MSETQITKQLQLNFLDEENVNSRLSLTNMREDLTEETVQAAMKVISESGVFEKDGVLIYAKPKSANYVERHVTSIFEAPKA